MTTLVRLTAVRQVTGVRAPSVPADCRAKLQLHKGAGLVVVFTLVNDDGTSPVFTNETYALRVRKRGDEPNLFSVAGARVGAEVTFAFTPTITLYVEAGAYQWVLFETAGADGSVIIPPSPFDIIA